MEIVFVYMCMNNNINKINQQHNKIIARQI